MVCSLFFGKHTFGKVCALCINESVLSLIINGKRKPSQERLKALAKILNVSIKDLYPNVEVKRINYYYI